MTLNKRHIYIWLYKVVNLMFLPLKSLISEVIILAPYYHAYIKFSKWNSKNKIPKNAKSTLFIWFLRPTWQTLPYHVLKRRM